jgi:hypothetical protein
MNESEFVKGLPEDVKEYFTIMSVTGGTMGIDLYRRCEKIIEDNPEFFPWEHKYKSIPESVHKAYLDEKYPERGSPLVEEKSEAFIGLIPTLKEFGNVTKFNTTDTPLDELLGEVFSLQDRSVEEKKERERANKSLWDKHYAKYGLPYRSTVWKII